MSKLINQVIEKYNATTNNAGSLDFTFGDTDFCLTDGTLYCVFDGKFGGAGKNVKTIKAVDKFVEINA